MDERAVAERAMQELIRRAELMGMDGNLARALTQVSRRVLNELWPKA